jgi:Domain of Unknown Function (DUF1259)
MKTIPALVLVLAGMLAFALPLSAAPNLPVEKIEAITGLKGKWFEDDQVFKVTRPRKDVPVAVEGMALDPFVGFSSWAAFTKGGKAEVMMMGDMVLFEDEVGPAMNAALSGGLGVTALHNHFLSETPRVFYMHIEGEGTAEQLATGLHQLFAAVDGVRAKQPLPVHLTDASLPAGPSAISPAPLEALFGAKPAVQAGMAKFVWGRTVTMDCGCPAGREMGVNTWATFAGTDARAVVAGDFAVLESELQPVLKSLTGHGIAVVAIHMHMTGETPRMLFMHYWGKGTAADLAGTVRAALALTAR